MPAHVPTSTYTSRFPNNTSLKGWQRVIEGPINGSISNSGGRLEEVWEWDAGGLSGVTASPNQNAGQMTSVAWFAQEFLGFSQSGGSGNGIKRTLPAQHPQLTYLFASSIGGIEGVGPLGRDQYACATFKLWRLRLVYETPPYLIVPDSSVTYEWERYTVIEINPATEFMRRFGGAWKWVAGVPDVGSRPVFEKNYTNFKITRTKIIMTWFQVPDTGLFVGGFENSTASPNIENAVGTVNSTTFMGRLPGTMLLEGWKPIPRTMPEIGVSNFPRSWDVQLTWTYFQPPPSAIDNNFAYGARNGHLLVPHPTRAFWYPPQYSADNSLIYPQSDHNQCFKMNS